MKEYIVKILDIFLIPFITFSGLVFKFYRKIGSSRLLKNTKLLKKIGVFPILDHYYEPLFNDSLLSRPLSLSRDLPGIDFRENEQLELLKNLVFQEDFENFLKTPSIRH